MTETNNKSKRIGVISDTHGLLRKEVIRLFASVDLILHAGDIGDAYIIEQLRKMAKVVAVLGNTDKDYYSPFELSKRELLEFESKFIYLIHNLDEVDINLDSSKIDIVVFGHTHRPEFFYKGNTLFFNPGSAGPERKNIPITAGIIEINDNQLFPEIYNLVE